MQPNRFEVVLDDGRDAVKRAREGALTGTAVERIGFRERVLVDLDDGVDGRTGLVEGLDSPQVLLDQRATRELTALQRGVDLGDGRFFELKRP